MLVVEVIGLFILRIGVPLLVLVAFGHTVDRWQAKQIEMHNRL